MVKILRSRRRRWRGVPLGGPLQRGCKFCFAAHDGARAECEAQVTDLHDTPAERRANIAECLEQHRPKPRPVAFRPWQEVWQCNDLRVTVTSNAPGMVNYDIAGSIWGGINFTFDGPRHQLYKGAWPCALVQ